MRRWLTSNRARRTRQQQRQQLGRVLRYVPIRCLGPRPHTQPEARLPAHPSRHTAPRGRTVLHLALESDQHRLRRWPPRACARDIRVLSLEGRSAPHEPRARQPSGQEGHHKQHHCLRAVPEQDDEGDIGEVQGCHRERHPAWSDWKPRGCRRNMYLVEFKSWIIRQWRDNCAGWWQRCRC